jgi:hypothetical protein
VLRRSLRGLVSTFYPTPYQVLVATTFSIYCQPLGLEGERLSTNVGISVQQVRPLTRVALVLIGLHPMARPAQSLKVGPHEEARPSISVLARVLDLLYCHASGDSVVYNLRLSPAAALTHWLRTNNKLTEPRPSLRAIQEGITLTVCDGVCLLSVFICLSLWLALITEADIIRDSTKTPGSATDAHQNARMHTRSAPHIPTRPCGACGPRRTERTAKTNERA